MKNAVIDIGSNSVRLMLSEDGVTLYKMVKNTRLAEGMDEKFNIQSVAIGRTVAAVSFFVEHAKSVGVKEIKIFATAATRKASNRAVFTDLIKDTTGIEVDVVSGEEEAKLGYIGALSGADGGVIDVGGASTEISVVKDGVEIYSKSIELGAVVIKDKCGQDKLQVEKFVASSIEQLGYIPNTNFYCIGGTATSVASMLLKLDPYDPKIVDGYLVERKKLEELNDMLFSLSIEERKKLKGLQPERAEIISGGVAVLVALMQKLNAESFRVSEKDNLEGYLISKMENL